MITYLDKKYENLAEMARKLKVSPAIASHLYHVNGGKCDDPSDLKRPNGVIQPAKKVEKPQQKVEKAPENQVDLDDSIKEILEDGEDGRLTKKSIKKIKDIKDKIDG